MSNIAMTVNGYQDGTVASRRNNDIIQLKAILDKDATKDGDKVYVQVVEVQSNGELIEAINENNILLQIMIKHLEHQTGLEISEDEIDGSH